MDGVDGWRSQSHLAPRRQGAVLFVFRGRNVDVREVNTNGVFQAGVPKLPFKVPAEVLFYDVSSDGKRFLMVVSSSAGAADRPKFTLVLNWQSALKK